MTEMVIEYDNCLSDHLEAERVFYRSTLWWKADKIVAVLLVVLGILCFLTQYREWAPIFFVLAVLEWFNLLTLRPLVIRHWYKHNPKFRERYRLTFSDGGIHFQTESIDSHVAWSHYSRILESSSIVLLVWGTRMYSVIPVRVFSGPTERAAFMDLVRRHISA
jgi:hypothetical protein